MSDRDNDWLRFGMSEIARKVTVPNLSNRAVRTSRRIGHRQLLITATAVVVVLLGTVVGVLKLAPRHGQPIPPATSAPTSSAPTSPTPTSPTPTVSSSATTGPNSPTALSGTVYYLDKSSSQPVLHAVTGQRDRVLPLSFDSGECPYQSIVVSPDGTQIGWVESHPIPDTVLSGDLMVSAIDGSGARLLSHSVSCLVSPQWTADSRAMLFRPTDDRNATNPKRVDVATGRVSAAPNGYTWLSPNGVFSVVGGKGGITIAKADGTNPYTFIYQPPNDTAHQELFTYGSWYAAGVSNEGRYVAIRHGGSDPTRALGTVCVVDASTGKDLALPGTGTLFSVIFLSDGRLLLERGTSTERRLLLTSPDGHVVAQANVPTGVAGSLLTYVP